MRCFLAEFTKAILKGRWDVQDVQGKMIEDYANEYGVDVSKIFERRNAK